MFLGIDIYSDQKDDPENFDPIIYEITVAPYEFSDADFAAQDALDDYMLDFEINLVFDFMVGDQVLGSGGESGGSSPSGGQGLSVVTGRGKDKDGEYFELSPLVVKAQRGQTSIISRIGNWLDRVYANQPRAFQPGAIPPSHTSSTVNTEAIKNDLKTGIDIVYRTGKAAEFLTLETLAQANGLVSVFSDPVSNVLSQNFASERTAHLNIMGSELLSTPYAGYGTVLIGVDFGVNFLEVLGPVNNFLYDTLHNSALDAFDESLNGSVFEPDPNP